MSAATTEAKPAMLRSTKITLALVGVLVASIGAFGSVIAAAVVALALLGAPLFAIMGGSSEIAWLMHKDAAYHHLRYIAPTVLDERFSDSPILVTIPLFTFVGYVLAESKTPERLVKASDALIGWMPGGLAIVCIFASAIFTLFTGGSGVTIIAIGGLLYPALRQAGYSEKFSLGIVTTSGSVGLLLPLSLPLMVYSLVAGVDMMLAFKAVLAPGLLVLVMLSGYGIFIGIKEKIPLQKIDPIKMAKGLWMIKWELGIGALLAVTLGTGLTQIDEVAGLVALYAVFIEFFVYKDLSIKKDLVRIAKSSMGLAGAVILILAMANALINFVIQKKIPDQILGYMLARGLDQAWQFLIVMNVFLLVLGMVMDGFSAILVAVPLVLPFAAHFGLGPFHVAIMFILNLELAFCLPPLGLNLFISSFRFGRPVVSLYKVVLPFAGILTIALFLVSYIPRLSDVLILGNIAAQREDAIGRGVPPREAWLLECVQNDRLNPLPCSEEDKKKWPNGIAAVTTPVAAPEDAGPKVDDEEAEMLRAMGVGGDAGKVQDAAAPVDDSEEELLRKMMGGGADAAAKPANTGAPTMTGNESEEDLLKMMGAGGGKKDGG
jgi:C4-dicarboxylate transporter, DctM subunit